MNSISESYTLVMICRYSPLDSKELLESFSKQTIDSCKFAFGSWSSSNKNLPHFSGPFCLSSF